MRRWRFIFEICAKSFLQYSHTYGFSPVWMRMWAVRLHLCLNPLLQCGQKNRLGTAADAAEKAAFPLHPCCIGGKIPAGLTAMAAGALCGNLLAANPIEFRAGSGNLFEATVSPSMLFPMFTFRLLIRLLLLWLWWLLRWRLR